VREGKPSFTAAAVAFARGVAGVDDVARRLLPAAFGAALPAARRARGALNVAAFGLVDHLELRTRAIDAAVEEAVGAGARQLVILGAGLDARAHRMNALGDVEVFEVDYPATQAYKRARTEGRTARAKGVRYVGVDFAKDSLEERLADAGHDPSRPTMWIWEGVTMYLPREATRATLRQLAARSAPGSRAAITYATPDGTPLGPGFVRAALVGFRVLGEPVVGMMTRGEMKTELGSAGFELLSDTDPVDWARDHASNDRRILVIRERLAVARKPAA
jgi:methyltransferase (TIGR00027 family)